jgi:hypothetical protein
MICCIENAFAIKLSKNQKGQYVLFLSEQGIESEKTESPFSNDKYIRIIINEDEEFLIDWYENSKQLFSFKRAQYHRMIPIRDDEECSIQFVLERWQSRMIKVQWKPDLHIEFGLYYEVCEDCD